MATMTIDKAAGTAAGPAPSRRSFGSMIRSIYQAIVEAQELRARTYVHGYLAHLTDEELARHGMTRDQMIRRTRAMMTSL